MADDVRIGVRVAPLASVVASNHFPPEVRLALQRAVATPVTAADPMARVRALNAAIERARLMFPHLFRQESTTCDTSW